MNRLKVLKAFRHVNAGLRYNSLLKLMIYGQSYATKSTITPKVLNLQKFSRKFEGRFFPDKPTIKTD